MKNVEFSNRVDQNLRNKKNLFFLFNLKAKTVREFELLNRFFRLSKTRDEVEFRNDVSRMKLIGFELSCEDEDFLSSLSHL